MRHCRFDEVQGWGSHIFTIKAYVHFIFLVPSVRVWETIDACRILMENAIPKQPQDREEVGGGIILKRFLEGSVMRMVQDGTK